MLEIDHVFTPEPGIIASGQPTKKDFTTCAERGVSMVINLRGEGEFKEFEEQEHVEGLGMRYVHLPISGPADVTLDKARELHELIESVEEGQLLIHCGSSNRVGALMALRAHDVLGKSKAESLTYGVRAGLTGLKDHVERVLSDS